MAHEVDYDQRLACAKRAVSDASVVCRLVQQDLENIQSTAKDDRSPVTIADWASQAVIIHRLMTDLGHAVVVAEEDSARLREPEHEFHLQRVVSAVRHVWTDATTEDVLDAIDHGGPTTDESEHKIFWTLDPIDGTKGFLRGQQYAVSLAWIEAGEPVVGILGCPNLSTDFSRPFDDPDPVGCLYFTYAGAGVYEQKLGRPDSQAVHIRRLAPAEGEPVRVCESVEAKHSNQSQTGQILAKLGHAGEPARLDSQAKYAVVARGQADAYLRMPTKKGYVERIWDHAAGALIATEAGCAVTDIAGELLDFGCGRGLEKNRGIVCAPPALHGRLLGAIAEVG